MTGADDFIAAGRQQLGYRALGYHRSAYGDATGYPGQPWAGSLLEVTARAAGLTEEQVPHLVSSAAALQWFVQRGQFFRVRPRAGDIAFFAFGSGGANHALDSQMHLGLITEVLRDGSFHVIEGQAPSPRALEVTEQVWVRELRRFPTDVIGYGRPLYRRTRKTAAAPQPGAVLVRSSNFLYGQNKPYHRLLGEALGRALHLTGITSYDPKAASALRQYQREHGVLDRDGTVVDDDTLRHLAEETGIFRV